MKTKNDIRYEFEIYMRRENINLPSSIWKVRSANLSYTVLLLFIFSFLIGFMSIGIWYLEIINSYKTFSNDFSSHFEYLNFYKTYLSSWKNISLINIYDDSLKYKLFMDMFLQLIPFILLSFSFTMLVPIGTAVCLVRINSYKIDNRDKKNVITNAFILNLVIMTASSTFLYSYYNIYLQSIYSINVSQFEFISSSISEFISTVIIYAFLFSFALLFTIIYIIDGCVLRIFTFLSIVSCIYLLLFLFEELSSKYLNSKISLYIPIILIILLNITYIINSYVSPFTSVKKLKITSYFSIKIMGNIIYFGMCAFIPVLTLAVSFFLLLKTQNSLIINNKMIDGEAIFISENDIKTTSMNDIVLNRNIIVFFEGPLKFALEVSILDTVLLILFYGQMYNSLLAYYFQVNGMINKVRKTFFWTSIWESLIIIFSFIIIGIKKSSVDYIFYTGIDSAELLNMIINAIFITISVSLSFLIGFLKYKKTLLHIILNSVITIFFSVILISIFLYRKNTITISGIGSNILLVQNITIFIGLISVVIAIITVFKKLSGVNFFIDDDINKRIHWKKIKYSDRVYKFNCQHEYLSSKKSKYVMTSDFSFIDRVDLKIEILRSKTQIKFLKYSLRDMRFDALSYNKELFESKKNELKILSSYNKYLLYKYKIMLSNNPNELSEKLLILIRKNSIFSTLENFELDIPNEISDNYIL